MAWDAIFFQECSFPQNPKKKIWKQASSSVHQSVWYLSGSWTDHKPGGWQTKSGLWLYPWARAHTAESFTWEMFPFAL